VKAIVVDDSKAMRTIVKRVLHECGIDDVIEAANAPAALDALHALDATEPTIAVVDADLATNPADPAIDVVDAVRAEAATRDLRVLTISATADGDPDVVKPFTSTMLRERVCATIAAA
jgi:CheY-like chemotaxis protein